ncbi:MAG: 30S ribosomal protein S13 [Candidatus Omnitrophota bacterium]|nr:30S ribosomal protein S13 [Candidatus Omnitrophota bacterium]
MPRIGGIDLPREKRIDVALTYLYGVGKALSLQILAKTGIDPTIRAKNLTDDQVTKIHGALTQTYKVEGDLRREISQNIRRLIEIGSYRGTRHRRGLPVRGQRTHTNARTRKGPRAAVGVRKRPTPGVPPAKKA